jgi:hypothetical protein
MDAKDPREALRKLDLLLGGRFRGTRYVADHMVVLTTVRAQAEQAMKDLRLEAFFKGARVGRPAVGTPDSETKTKIEWGLDADDELRGFVPPEDHGQPLYGIQKDPADAPALPGVPPRDGGGNGRLVFLSPEPVQGEVTEARGIRDSPLVLECPFVPSRYIAVSFRYCSPAPLYLQVSIVGNHIGVLTDDGSRTSGRGVFGWQDDDWRNADQAFPEVYRHDYVRTTIAPRYPDLLKFPSKQGQRYFQFEPGVAYDVRVVWNSPAGHLQLFVDGEEKWNVDLRDKLQRDKPPRIRIVTYTPCWIDDLAIEGTPDENYIDRLLRGK